MVAERVRGTWKTIKQYDEKKCLTDAKVSTFMKSDACEGSTNEILLMTCTVFIPSSRFTIY